MDSRGKWIAVSGEDRGMNLTFEFPFRGDREKVQTELRRCGFESQRVLARVGDQALLEVVEVADQQQVLEVEAIVRRTARASRRVGTDPLP
jgi:hypothetical protein